MVVTVEPGIYLPDWGGIRIEDDVLVTPDGCEVLTHVPKSLDSVRLEPRRPRGRRRESDARDRRASRAPGSSANVESLEAECRHAGERRRNRPSPSTSARSATSSG